MNIYSIYKITNTLNGMSYIGYSKNYEFRWSQYRKIKPGKTYKRKIERAISKYGINAFQFDVLYQSKHRDHALDEMEDYFINEFDTIVSGYNMRVGGQWAHTDYQTAEEVKAKISATLKETYKNNPKLKDDISAFHFGKKQAPDHVERRIAATVASPKFIIGRQATAEKLIEKWKAPTDKMLEGIVIGASKRLGKPLSAEHRANVAANNKSSVVWLLRWEGQYHYVTDSVNDYVNKTFPFMHPIVYTTLKKHPDYENKSKLVWGIKGRGPSKGFEVVRIPESMLSMGSGLVDHLIACKAATDALELNMVLGL